MAKIDHIITLNFKAHLISKKNHKECFQILKYIINDDRAFIIKTIMNDEETENLFKNWEPSQIDI